MSRGYLSRGSVIIGGSCPGAIIWGQFSYVLIVLGAIVWEEIALGGNYPGRIAWGAIVLGGNCPGGNCPGGNCPVPQKIIEKYSKMDTKANAKSALLSLRTFLTAESPLIMMKKVFCFTSKALFVLEIFKFLS